MLSPSVFGECAAGDLRAPWGVPNTMRDRCETCHAQWPGEGYWIANLGETILYLNPDQFFPGASLLVLKRHATELFQLTRGERTQLVEEITAVARTLMDSFAAVKINYALLGNQVQHMHWHVIPRLVNDPAPRDAPWAIVHGPRQLTPDEAARRVTTIRASLDRDPGPSRRSS